MFLEDILKQLSGMQWPNWLQPYIEVLLLWISWAIDYVDWDYLEYLAWLFLPIFIAFVLPIFLVLFIYGCVIFLHIYGLRHRIREAYASSLWDGARISIASFWDAVGYVWHGYEIRGIENVPDSGPALFLYYHGTLPLDVYYVIAKCMLHKKRTLHCVGDKFIFKIPGWGLICKVFCITPGTVEDCITRLKEGHLLCISPGGVREALFSDPSRYNIMWGRRLGFARVVIGAQTPVIPMFTENCRDAFRTPQWGRKVFRWIYEKSKWPLCPIYGGFPVKMITHLGKPINFMLGSAPEDVKRKVKHEVSDLIRQHQCLPGSILRGILQRFYDKRRHKRDVLLEDTPNANSTHNDTNQQPLTSTTTTSFNHNNRILHDPGTDANLNCVHDSENNTSSNASNTNNPPLIFTAANNGTAAHSAISHNNNSSNNDINTNNINKNHNNNNNNDINAFSSSSSSNSS